MKQVYNVFIICLLIFSAGNLVVAQNTITLNFSAEHSTTTTIIPLDSVHIENITTATDTMIYGATPSIEIVYLGIDGTSLSAAKDVSLFAYPNPSTSVSKVEVSVPVGGDYNFLLIDQQGRVEYSSTTQLLPGVYAVDLQLKSKGIYHFSVSNSRYSADLQLVSAKGTGTASMDVNQSLSSLSLEMGASGLKSTKAIGTLEFSLGDELFVTAYKYGYEEDTMTIFPTQSTTAVFLLEPTAYCPSSVFDFDGNEYNVVAINGVCWMAENMRTTHYADGASIDYVQSFSQWGNLAVSDRGYCFYGFDSLNLEAHGNLYNWAAAMNGHASTTANPSDEQGICPVGWHLPSDEEWDDFGDFIATDNGGAAANYSQDSNGDWAKVGKHLKTVADWGTGTAAGTNDYGFAGKPGGNRTLSGSYSEINETVNWWSATQFNSDVAYAWGLSDQNHKFLHNSVGYKKSGYYVRCVRD